MLRTLFKIPNSPNIDGDDGEGQPGLPSPRASGLTAPAHTPSSSFDSPFASRSASPVDRLNDKQASVSKYGTINTTNLRSQAGPSTRRSVEPETPVMSYEPSPIDGANDVSGSDDNQRQDGIVREEVVSERRKGWRGKLRNYAPYLELENSGSVARDHLALERTFLAYVRTSLAISSAGVALIQLFSLSSTSDRVKRHLTRFATPLGAAMIGIGLIVLLIGLVRYFRVQAALITGRFHPAQRTVAFLSFTLASLVAIVFAVLVRASS